MYISGMQSILEMVWNARDVIVPCFLSDPGVGKTQSIYEFAEKKGVNVVEIIASQILPNEVSGITMPRDDTHSMEIYDHARLASLKDGDILFFDELLQASPQTLSACLTLIQERRMMSGKKLPDVMIVAAANPLNSPDMVPESIRQRFMFINVEYSAPNWSEYIIKKYPSLKVYQVERLADYIKEYREKTFNSGNWNSLTARSAEKLIILALNSASMIKVRNVIREMYGSTISDFIMACIPNNDQIRIAKIVSQFTDTIAPSELYKMTMKELLEAINSLENSEEIFAALKEVESVSA